MKTQKLAIGVSDVAQAKGVNYRACLRDKNAGEFFLDNEKPEESLLSVSVYVCNSSAFWKLTQMQEEL